MKKILFLAFIILSLNYVSAQSNSEIFSEAVQLYKSEQYSAALRLLDKIEKSGDIENNIYSSALYYKAEALFKTGQTDGAVPVLEKIVREFETSPYRKHALYTLGTFYFDNKEYSRCRERLLNLIKEYPDSEYVGNSYYWIGESYSEEKKYNEAELFLKRGLPLGSKNEFIDYTIFTLGQVNEKKGDYDNAVKYYDELLTYHLESKLYEQAHLRIGISYFNLGEYESAVLELLDPAIEDLPFQLKTEAKYYLANSYYKMGEFDKSAEIFENVLNEIKDSGDEGKIKYGLAWVNFQMGKYSDSYSIFKELAESEPGELAQSSLFWSGECKRYLGQDVLARGIYEDFIQKYPESSLMPLVKFSVGLIYFNDGSYDKAKPYLNDAVNSEDKNASSKANNLLGEIFLKEENYSLAHEYFTSAAIIEGIDADLINRAKLGSGIADFYLKNYDLTINELSTLLEKSPKFEKEKVSFYIAESYFAKKDYKQALKYYSNIRPSYSKLGELSLYGLAYSYFNMKDFPNSAFYFKEFSQKFNSSARYYDALMRLGDSYYGTKNFEDASEAYSKVFNNKNSPKTDFGYFQYAQSLFKADEYNGAVDKLEILQSVYPRSRYADDAQYLIGWINFQKGDFRRAVSEYNEVLDNYRDTPLRPIIYYSIGDAYFNLGEYDEAIASYERIMIRFPKSEYVFDAINGIQYCYVALGEPEEAVKYIDRFISANPTNVYGDDILFKKGEIFYNNGNYNSARVSYKELIATYPSSEFVPNAYYWIGKSAQMLDQTEDAVFNFQRVADIYLYSDVGTSAVIELADIYIAKEEYGKALDVLDKAVENNPDAKSVPELKYKQGLIYREIQDRINAYSTFADVINNYSENIFIEKSKLELGRLELERLEYEKAKDLFSDLGSNRLDDIGAEAQYLYGVCLYEQENYTDAISALVRVRSVFASYDEWFTKSLLKLGDCYIKLKDWSKARDMFRAVLSRHKNDEYGQEANKKLRQL